MIEFGTLYNNLYLRVFVVSIIIYIANVLILIEKIKKKLNVRKESSDKILVKKFRKVTPMAFIKMYDELRESRAVFATTENYISQNIWGGVIFLSGCLVGFIAQQFGVSQDLGIMLIFLGFVLFFVTLIYLLYWYVKK